MEYDIGEDIQFDYTWCDRKTDRTLPKFPEFLQNFLLRTEVIC